MAFKNAMECYGEVHMTLPNGREVVGKVPTLKQQLKVMAMLEEVASSRVRKAKKARERLVSWYPKLVGLEEELNQLTWEEFFDVIQRFFGRRGSANSQPEETESLAPEALASSVSLPITPDTTAPEPAPICTGPSS